MLGEYVSHHLHSYVDDEYLCWEDYDYWGGYDPTISPSLSPTLAPTVKPTRRRTKRPSSNIDVSIILLQYKR